MFFRIVMESLTRQRARKLVAIAAVALGTAVMAALLNLGLNVGDQIRAEASAYGANIRLAPAQERRLMAERDVLGLGGSFWRNNMTAVAPRLTAAGEAGAAGVSVVVAGVWFDKSIPAPGAPGAPGSRPIPAGMKPLNPGWQVEGRWPSDDPVAGEGLLGAAAARDLHVQPGASLPVRVGASRVTVRVAGVASTGSDDDHALFVPLALVQQWTGLAGRVNLVEVSALTTPETELARRVEGNLTAAKPADVEMWSCTAYPSSVAHSLGGAVAGSRAAVVRQVAETQGAVMNRVSGLLAVVGLAAVLAAVLAVMSALLAMVLERRQEVGLLKALGATSSQVVGLFLAESFVLGLAGGLAGAAAGIGISCALGGWVFGTVMAVKPLVLPAALAVALVIVLSAAAAPVRVLAAVDPARVLHGG